MQSARAGSIQTHVGSFLIRSKKTFRNARFGSPKHLKMSSLDAQMEHSWHPGSTFRGFRRSWEGVEISSIFESFSGWAQNPEPLKK